MRKWSHDAAVMGIGTLLLWACLPGCAIENSGLPGSRSAIIRAYSRNAVVGVPTLVGNTVGALIAAPALIALNKYNLYQPDAPGYWVAWTAAGPVYFLGGVTGTPFLPFSLLLPERRIVWEGERDVPMSDVLATFARGWKEARRITP